MDFSSWKVKKTTHQTNNSNDITRDVPKKGGEFDATHRHESFKIRSGCSDGTGFPVWFRWKTSGDWSDWWSFFIHYSTNCYSDSCAQDTTLCLCSFESSTVQQAALPLLLKDISTRCRSRKGDVGLDRGIQSIADAMHLWPWAVWSGVVQSGGGGVTFGRSWTVKIIGKMGVFSLWQSIPGKTPPHFWRLKDLVAVLVSNTGYRFKPAFTLQTVCSHLVADSRWTTSFSRRSTTQHGSLCCWWSDDGYQLCSVSQGPLPVSIHQRASDFFKWIDFRKCFLKMIYIYIYR